MCPLTQWNLVIILPGLKGNKISLISCNGAINKLMKSLCFLSPVLSWEAGSVMKGQAVELDAKVNST